jgi:hypothetical protein
MTIRYCGLGGSNANSGLTWALRKLTLNGVEDTPVVAGDIVYVGPGVYRELLTVDVSGSSGNPITYIGDVTGEHTDGVGGIVRITGSDNDQTATRANCIIGTSRNYRTFRGFTMDVTTANTLNLVTSCSNWITEDCHFSSGGGANTVSVAGTGTGNTFRRCIFIAANTLSILFTHSAVVDNAGHLVENCLFISPNQGVSSSRVGGITVRNCTFVGGVQAVRVSTALSVGQTVTVNNCIIVGTSAAALQAITLPATNPEITENYNSFFGNTTSRNNVNIGANSNNFPPLFAMPMLLEGYRFPWEALGLSQWSQMRRVAGTGMSTDDVYGILRPTVEAKRSWGAIQFHYLLQESSIVRTGIGSLRIATADVHQMFVPTTAVPTTFSCYVQWGVDYAGTKPQMIVKQPGRADTTITATGDGTTWELLTTTLTPTVVPSYCVVEFKSNSTALSGNQLVFFDDFVVT